jgi:hypothetical protein
MLIKIRDQEVAGIPDNWGFGLSLIVGTAL